MKQTIGTRSMILPQGTEIRTLGELPNGSMTVVQVKLEEELLVQTTAPKTYEVSPAPQPWFNKDSIIGFLLAVIVLLIAF